MQAQDSPSPSSSPEHLHCLPLPPRLLCSLVPTRSVFLLLLLLLLFLFLLFVGWLVAYVPATCKCKTLPPHPPPPPPPPPPGTLALSSLASLSTFFIGPYPLSTLLLLLLLLVGWFVVYVLAAYKRKTLSPSSSPKYLHSLLSPPRHPTTQLCSLYPVFAVSWLSDVSALRKSAPRGRTCSDNRTQYHAEIAILDQTLT